ncbi:MAG: YcnI family protein [Thermomicrobiales bacterium]|nr:YcnI family protein [Thermomicrobiales bacterium]
MICVSALRKAALSVVVSCGIALVSVFPAAAHVGVKADTTAAGSTAILTFGFSHGCGESPTTGLTFQIPEEFTSVNPVYAPGWEISWETEDLATPVVSAHGTETTSRISTVTFTADEPIVTGIYAMVSLRLTLPEDMAGETIYFPVVQECEEGENAWIEIPADGQDAEELESPAPSINVTDAESDAGH